ncbi:ERF family protein [Terrisporobacter muris]|uniref:ERF family protein n=1 Tax=Terrisporobacter muris TaxID=2963284 RepID=A0A9X2S146_9FIRM|nr:ERF family protein [Terrisporobacter muris]MCR1822628.1 ERF family protein [Terrisporobacter muris]
MSDKLNIHQKLVEVKKGITGFSKDTKAGSGNYIGYEYVSGSQVLRAIKGKMDELGVLLIPEVDYETMKWEKHNYKTKNGAEKTDFIITMKMNYTWINAENPQDKITVPWVCIGQQTDDIAKAVGTAMTYNERYFLLKFLGLPTDEDDADAKPLNKDNITNLSTDNKWTNPKLTDNQIKRLYAIAYKKGIGADKVKEQVLKKFNKEVSGLTKTEYDKVCEGYEKIQIAN